MNKPFGKTKRNVAATIRMAVLLLLAGLLLAACSDDDTTRPAGILVTAESPLATTEAGGSDTFTLLLNSQPGADVTIEVSTSDGSEGLVSAGDPAPAGTQSISVNFTPANWATAQTITVSGVDDGIDDGDQDFIILISAAASTDLNYDGIDPDDLAATNADNDESLEIIGTYNDDFGTAHTIGQTQWDMDFGSGFGTATFAILQFSNGADFLVAQNGADNAFNPDLFSQFDWTTFETELYFCQSTFDAATEAEAAAAAVADNTDPTMDGCGGFAWSRLTPQ